MALGAITRVSQTGQAPNNPIFHDHITLVGDGAYPTGGSTGLLTKLRSLAGAQGRTIKTVLPVDCKGYVPGWDAANAKLKFYRIGALDGNAASAGPLSEVGNAVDLSGVTFELLVISE